MLVYYCPCIVRNMRPLTLRLEGFQGFLEPETIDLSNITAAAITGPVGAGKTSILDAITYALYGASRTSTKDEVIHTHAKSMLVEMDFALNGGTYKIRRTRTRSGSAKAYLWHVVDGELISIGDGDGRAGATEAALAEIYPISYETYRASVLVEQGKSGTFIESKPSERHALMGEILGLDQFKAAEKVARAQLTEAKNLVARLDTLLEGKEEAEEKAQHATQALESAKVELEKATAAEADALKVQKAAKAKAVETAKAVDDARAQNAKSLDAITEASETNQEAQAAYTALVTQIDALTGRIGDGENYLAAANERLAAEGQRLKAAAENTRGVYERQYGSAPVPVDALTAAAQQAQAQVAEAQQYAQQAAQDLSAAQADATAAAQAVSELSAAHEGLTKEWREENQRLRTYQGQGGHPSTCHTCGQHVDDVTIGRIINDLTQRLSAIGAQGKQVKASLEAAQGQKEAADKAVASAHRRVAEAQGQVQAAHAEASAAAANLSRAQAQAQGAEQAKNAAEAAQAELEAFEEGNSAAHQDVAKAVALLEKYEAERSELSASLSVAKSAADAAEADLQATREANPVIDTEDLAQANDQAQGELEAARTQAAEASAAMARAEAATEAATARAQDAQDTLGAYDQHTKDRKKAMAEQKELAHTVAALSPTGIPQMKMNAAIQTMNAYLHEYLQDISGNVLTAELTTTLETKAGGSKNEINIQVTGDDGKPRLYESFSGGQKFLTDFALHMTNARLLAEQRGAVVDFCAIDEGWNSLEGEEKTAVLRAVQKLGETYSLVLTVTHDDDVVNSMPQQVKVERTSGTSTVKVMA